ncbi:hypothetical protein D3C81_767480 [compost metagenome]
MTFSARGASILIVYVAVKPLYVIVSIWLSSAVLLSKPLTMSAVTGTVVLLPSLQLTSRASPVTSSDSPTQYLVL